MGEWTYEIKPEGYRLQAVKSKGTVTLYSRRKNIPKWHRRARFHGALLLFLRAGVSAAAVAVMEEIRRAHGRRDHRGSIAASFWTSFFYIPFLVPGSTLWAGKPGGEPFFLGHLLYPNIVAACIFLAITTITCTLARRATRAP
jgi:hypothetical protein